MKKTKKAFSIIEVITASLILSIAVFGVFKLISENQKIINNSDNYNTAISLFLPFSECIENKKTETLIISNQKFFIKIDDCSISSSNSYNRINNIEYEFYGSGTGDNKFDLFIQNETLKIKQEYILK